MIVPNEMLRAGRAAAGITQSELSELSGVGKCMILRIERNERVAVSTSRWKRRGSNLPPAQTEKDPACASPCLCSRVTI